ncbi:MAG: 50S ribosomal protein L29 [Chloroflexota bacterium]|nr:50S ribosomal protein L29 [Chloroflexota bacterium]
MADAKELRDLDHDKLVGRLNDAREELMNLRFQQSSGELTDFNRLSVTRREIARILTILNESQQTTSEENSE